MTTVYYYDHDGCEWPAKYCDEHQRKSAQVPDYVLTGKTGLEVIEDTGYSLTGGGINRLFRIGKWSFEYGIDADGNPYEDNDTVSDAEHAIEAWTAWLGWLKEKEEK